MEEEIQEEKITQNPNEINEDENEKTEEANTILENPGNDVVALKSETAEKPKEKVESNLKKFTKLVDIVSFSSIIIAILSALASVFLSNKSFFVVAIAFCLLSLVALEILFGLKLSSIIKKQAKASKRKNAVKSEKIAVIFKIILILLIICFVAFMLCYMLK